MARYTNADFILESTRVFRSQVFKCCEDGYERGLKEMAVAVKKMIDNNIAENVVEVVLCGQCKSCVAGETVYDMFCEELDRNCYTIGYCGLGERKAVE